MLAEGASAIGVPGSTTTNDDDDDDDKDDDEDDDEDDEESMTISVPRSTAAKLLPISPLPSPWLFVLPSPSCP
eukprot:CAMPEP_0173384512 /NCGR_PEP_ID=MMETSP1356-20130122/7086_1 /TAXON_ID=77927 ORGANISM="Hemiselmis virescens, Strain PCC157" /NCGR_SAMPLE_ID=MMETSP1356 /ASSEMBLY_ACC=CAM_ASM_000847 /LENGTH=72 /DNA_ID=CAMNT_0014339901 /DNA_START=351 /DNA_END=566 /DNA_ORIENTATION=+